MKEENIHKYRWNSKKHINYFTESYKRKKNVETYNYPKCKIYSGSGTITKQFKYKPNK